MVDSKKYLEWHEKALQDLEAAKILYQHNGARSRDTGDRYLVPMN